jgi:hypothetical protein
MAEASENLGTSVILENERVRIWEHRVAPGATGPMHLHRRPYFSVFVHGSGGDTVDPDGNVIEYFDLTPGTVVWRGGGPARDARAEEHRGRGDPHRHHRAPVRRSSCGPFGHAFVRDFSRPSRRGDP